MLETPPFCCTLEFQVMLGVSLLSLPRKTPDDLLNGNLGQNVQNQQNQGSFLFLSKAVKNAPF